MKKHLLIIALFALSTTLLHSQKISSFSTEQATFFTELETFMSMSNREDLKESYLAFSSYARGGSLTTEQLDSVISVCNEMLGLKMTAKPYFMQFFSIIQSIENQKNSDQKYAAWLDVYRNMLQGVENRKLNPIKTYLKFSESFFTNNAIKYSKSGSNWLSNSDDFHF